MCIIIAKKAGVTLDMEELESAASMASHHNSHGIGFALKRKGSNNIILSKGYRYYEMVLDKLSELKVEDDDELMVHMRFATSGKTDIANCHPYVVSNNLDNILLDEAVIINHSVVSHNGTFDWYAEAKSEFSDTVHYIKEFLSAEGVLEGMRTIKKADSYQMHLLMQANRLCIINPDKDLPMDLYGSWNRRKLKSLVYSNFYHIQPYNGYTLDPLNKAKVL